MKIPKWGRLIFICCSIYRVNSLCSGKRCGECLIKDQCSWCKDRNFTKTRCAIQVNLKMDGCINIVQRKNHVITHIKNSNFSDGGPGQDSVQIRPQHVSIKLVPNLILRDFSVSYKIANNFPLDLYFLNDPSPSMKSLKSSLKSLAKSIASGIQNLTTDFRFGLGTSMDKAVRPFSRTSAEFLDDPCFNTTDSVCDKVYSFKHRLNLTDDIEAFEKAIDDVKVTANFDKPVGMFDGLIQTMVCGDYPSVGQIIEKAKENNINIIFVIGGNTSRSVRHLFYDTLATLLPGNTLRASGLSLDSRNILDIVSNNYKRLRGTVKLVVNGYSDNLTIKLYTNCRTGG